MAERKIARQHVIAKLLTSAVYHDDEGYWQVVIDDKPTLEPYFAGMGVRLEVDTEMGMGYLRPLNPAEEEDWAVRGMAPLPRIIPPRQLGYPSCDSMGEGYSLTRWCSRRGRISGRIPITCFTSSEIAEACTGNSDFLARPGCPQGAPIL